MERAISCVSPLSFWICGSSAGLCGSDDFFSFFFKQKTAYGITRWLEFRRVLFRSIRVFFQPNVKIDMALAQVTAISQTLLRIFPPGTFPPNILKYDASSVPILQLGLESKTLSEQDIFDLGLNFIRTQLATVQGAAVPLPYGGKFRQIMVDLIPDQLYAKGISATDVSNAVSAQSIILPAGTAKIGK